MNLPASDSTTVARLVCADKTAARRIADLLDEMLDGDEVACASFEADDGSWQVALHFADLPDQAELRRLVASAAGEDAAAALIIETVETRDWVAESLAGLTPVRAGRFVVHGSHDRQRLKNNDLNIEIEAALAFGTGHHGTTRGCLMALDMLAKKKRRFHVLDIGTGSGVLAIAAAKIFHTRPLASDIDPVAVAAARDNARLNRVGPLVSLAHAPGTRDPRILRGAPYDLIFANILLGPLTRLAAPIARLVAPGGRVVLSGLLPSHANAARSIYAAQGLHLERRRDLEGWTTLILRR
ncbi:ribosomal protein L11 methyltransferase [Pseudolabrys sp. Root1462]|uniref:50S ribosomal protein L11 methyltransferase n=1 Tax=Pseudolabrys sp. Root1462 TaxID=1736466 RepID=UPI0007027EBA|nr:50S ribosomal protein L11 methyltransferase [Pseudolabrys sp. Root1462]KQY99989.1 ribosomal protein L11 methyltransferase [Pseudolabrys sp. Root1462]